MRKEISEYLSNMTSDFSDGTNGEPSTSGPHPGDGQTAVGMPDYKYLERLKKRKEKLKALIQRRDPDGIEKRIGESLEPLVEEPTVDMALFRWLAGTQVADARGYPLVVYHSSPYSFRKFDTSAEGAHFGTLEQATNLRKPGKKQPRAYFLKIKNPLRMRDIGVWSNFSNVHGELARTDVFDVAEMDAVWDEWQWSDARGWEALKKTLGEKGYDGIVYENEQEGSGDSWIAFWSDQIRPVPKSMVEGDSHFATVQERLSPQEMRILKRSTRRRKRLREDEEDDLDVSLEPTPDYKNERDKLFGWSLTLGNEQQILSRMRALGRTRLDWNKINEDYSLIERKVVGFFKTRCGFWDEGHASDGDLVGSGSLIPADAPPIWRMISGVPEGTYIDLIEIGPLIGLSPKDVFDHLVDPISRRVLKPKIMFFDVKDDHWVKLP